MTFKGVLVSKGIVIGRVFKYSKRKTIINSYNITDDQIANEINLFSEAKITANKILREIKEEANHNLGTMESQIFDAHIHMLNDPVLDETIKEFIKNEKINVEAAIKKAVDGLTEKFTKLDNDYFKERLKDIQDVVNHILNALDGKSNRLIDLFEKSVIIAEDLTPSETALINKEMLGGFVLTEGGMTAHTTIISKSLMIPTVINVEESVLDHVKHGDTIILDALKGELIIEPEKELLELYKHKIQIYNKKEKELFKMKDEISITKDGCKIELAANINSLDEINSVFQVNGDGIGLLRTEFLFLKEEHLLDEERQYKIYREIAETMKGKPVTIRLIDIGGDKDLPYFDTPQELNPFLGWRGIRISLDRQDIFRAQLKALLRASRYGNIKVLIPFISSIEELRKVKGLIIDIENELEQENIDYNRNIEIGLMIEIPSTAILADVFAKEVDFFSIGTNDLIQYTIAVDRNNSKIASLYSPFHPAVLKLIKQVVTAANNEGIRVSVCGEAAANQYLVPIFVAMGITELSMSSGYILEIKKVIRKMDRTALDYHQKKVMQMTLASEIEEYLMNNIGQ